LNLFHSCPKWIKYMKKYPPIPPLDNLSHKGRGCPFVKQKDG
jgi:hypothetical protein